MIFRIKKKITGDNDNKCIWTFSCKTNEYQREYAVTSQYNTNYYITKRFKQFSCFISFTDKKNGLTARVTVEINSLTISRTLHALCVFTN